MDDSDLAKEARDKPHGEKDGNVDGLTRRGMFQAATVAAAATGIAAVSTRPAHALWPTKPTPRFKSVKPHEGGMFTYTVGYTDEEVYWWEGRNIGGAPIGIVQLSANIPMIPGNVGNASTFDFTLIYQPMEVSGDMVVSVEPHPEVLKRTIEAGKALEAQGCRAIVGNCGFFGNYQPLVAEALDAPFFSTSLLQIPTILATLKPGQKILVMTATGAVLEKAPALENCGVSDRSRLVIAGAENGSEMQKVLTVSGSYNPKKLEKELVDIAVENANKFPEIGAILLECTEFSAHAFAIQEAVGLPAWDFTTMINWVYSGLVRRPFAGFV
jgi:Asp/Glu/hydantoin racemase